MDSDRFTNEFIETWKRVHNEAEQRALDLISPELLLYGLLDDPAARLLLQEAKVDVQKLENELNDYLLQNAKDFRYSHSELPDGPYLDRGASNIIQRAYISNQRGMNPGKPIDGIDILMAFYAEPECIATMLLQGELRRHQAIPLVSRIENRGLRNALNGKGKSAVNDNFNNSAAGTAVATIPEPKAPVPGDALKAYCANLMDKAASGKIDPVIGRTAEIERTVQVLSRRTKNNPIFVGAPGVGKTAIVEGLALGILEGKVPEDMRNDYILTLDMGALVAGTRYRGDFEERLKSVIKELKEFQDGLAKYQKELAEYNEKTGKGPVGASSSDPKVHLFIDEIHTLVGAGAAGSSAMDASNLLKPALANGEMSCIGATTYDEFRNSFAKDKALVRRFQKIDVKEPTVAETYEILKGLKARYEKHHGVTYTDEALKKAAALAERYINDRQLPDSAIDLIDEIGASQKSKPLEERKKVMDVADIEAVVAKIARIPPANVSDDDKTLLKNLAADMKKVVFGQDQAIDKLAGSVKLARAGMREPEKPIGCYLFEGPTGVGKTEVTKQLAEKLGLHMVRIDMSEYMEKHAVSRLIGPPPGYVGFDQEGLLTGPVDQNPHCVVLLDEIEKAHPDIYNILLQVMDNGTLTDNKGKAVSFRNVILIMTTNAGAAERAEKKPQIGFVTSKEEDVPEENAAIGRTFSPEFINRLDDVVAFKNLKPEHMGAIVDKFIGQLEKQLGERNIKIELEDKARTWIAGKGYDKRMGARPMGRVIQEFVKKPLAEEVLFGKLQNGGTVNIRFNEEAAKEKDSGGSPLEFVYMAANSNGSQKPLRLPHYDI